MRLASSTRNVMTVGFLLTALAFLSAQNAPKSNSKSNAGKGGEPDAGSKSEKAPEDVMPVSLVTFSEAKAVPSAVSSPGTFAPVTCTPDGTVVFNQPVPPTFLVNRVTAASLSKPDATVSIDSGSVPGLKYVQFRQSFAGESEIAILASGQKVEEAQADRDAESHSFILIYDRKGSFQEAVQLKVGFDVLRFGVLKSGKFVITGYDSVRRLPRVAIVDSDGELLRFIDLKLDSDDQVRGVAPAGQAEAAKSANPFFADQDLLDFAASQQLVSYGGNLLLVTSGTNLPVFEIGDGGILRSTMVKVPKGSQIQWFIPSDSRRWIVQMERGADKTKPVEELYEIDPETGELVRRFEVKGKQPMIACAVENSFVSFRIDELGKEKQGATAQLMMMTGAF